MLAMSLLLCQAAVDPVRAVETAEMRMRAQGAAVVRQRQDSAAQSRQDFEAKFKKLLDALSEFSKEYNQQGGNVVARKKIQAIEKAIHDLQQTSTWKLSVKQPSGTPRSADAPK